MHYDVELNILIFSVKVGKEISHCGGIESPSPPPPLKGIKIRNTCYTGDVDGLVKLAVCFMPH
jgi:hypothetical protein